MSVRPSWAQPQVCRRPAAPTFTLGLGPAPDNISDVDLALRDPPKPPLVPRLLACACVLWAVGSVIAALAFVGRTLQTSGVFLDTFDPTVGKATGEGGDCLTVIDTSGMTTKPSHVEVAALLALERASGRASGTFDSLLLKVNSVSLVAFVLRASPCTSDIKTIIESQQFHSVLLDFLRSLRSPHGLVKVDKENRTQAVE